MIGKFTDASSKLSDFILGLIIITFVGLAITVFAVAIEQQAENRIGKHADISTDSTDMVKNIAGQVVESTDSFYVIAYAISGPLMILGILVMLGGFVAMFIDKPNTRRLS